MKNDIIMIMIMKIIMNVIMNKWNDNNGMENNERKLMQWNNNQ